MKTRMKVLFWFRKNISNPARPGAIVCRITVQGCKNAVNFTVASSIEESLWSVKAHRLLGNAESSARVNRELVKVANDLNDIHADLERRKRPVTASRIYHLYKAKDLCALSVLGLYEAFLNERKNLIGTEISPATQQIALTRYNKLQRFLATRKETDLRPEDFRPTLGDQYIHWLLLVEGLQRNVANKYLQSVAQVLTWAVRREYLDANPLKCYEYKRLPPKDLVYLNREELETLSCFEFATESLSKARDCFVFQCWTGLAYADLEALDVASCVETENGRRVLRIQRAKSTIVKGYKCVIPLHSEAERILAHYKDKLPVISNQRYNLYLKEVALLCGLGVERLASHIGRKTAGVTLLNTGIPMEVVSKMLGHSSVTQTERTYAKILDKTVVDAFDKAFGPAQTLPVPALKVEEGCRVVQFRLGA